MVHRAKMEMLQNWKRQPAIYPQSHWLVSDPMCSDVGPKQQQKKPPHCISIHLLTSCVEVYSNWCEHTRLIKSVCENWQGEVRFSHFPLLHAALSAFAASRTGPVAMATGRGIFLFRSGLYINCTDRRTWLSGAQCSPNWSALTLYFD